VKSGGHILTIRKADFKDVKAITAIYNHYIEHSISTFEEQILSNRAVQKRLVGITNKYVWLVGEVEGKVIGYAYAGQWKTRSAYRLTVETSIYLKPGTEGKGYGKAIYSELLDQVEQLGYKCLIGGISLPNPSSIKLHESLGFVKIGQFVKVGIKFGEWIDVGYWEKRFED
jgi:L-amino acid N-acyltransferase YncA